MNRPNAYPGLLAITTVARRPERRRRTGDHHLPRPGTAPPANYDWKAEPSCGHKYTWMSTKERTGGIGKWPISATSNWNVTWQSNTGVSGTATLSATGNDALEIGEYRIVLVQGPGG